MSNIHPKSLPVLVLLAAIGVGAAGYGVYRYQQKGAAPEAAPETAAAEMPGQAAAPRDPSVVVALVDSTEITQGQVDHQVELIARAQGIPQDSQHASQIAAMLEQRALESLVMRNILNNAVKKENIAVPPAQVDEEYAKTKTYFENEEKFNAQMQAMGLTEDKLKEQIAANLAIEQLLDNHIGPTEPTAEEIKEYMANHGDSKIGQPSEVKASHILVKVESTDDETVKKTKRAKAEDLLAQLKKGGVFADLALQHSDCPSKSQGGDLGWFTRDRMVKPFADAAFALKKGEMSGIVETDFGYHIILKTDEKILTQDAIKDELQEQKKRNLSENYIRSLREAANVQYPGRPAEAAGSPHGGMGMGMSPHGGGASPHGGGADPHGGEEAGAESPHGE